MIGKNFERIHSDIVKALNNQGYAMTFADQKLSHANKEAV